MAITISGQNNNDKILASDGVLDSISGFNVVGVMTATTFDVTTKHTANHIDVGSTIQLGNAGIITATTLIGNVTGNVNSTSHLLLQISGSEKFRVGNGGQLGIGGANYGTSGQVLSSGGSGSAATWQTIDLSNLNASNLTSGTVPNARISAGSVTQHVTAFDDNNIVNDISALALKVSALENSAASNTNSTFVDTYQDSAGISTITTAARDSSGEFIATVYDSTTTYDFNVAGTHGQPQLFGINECNNYRRSAYWTNDQVRGYNSGQSRYGLTIVDFAFDLSGNFTHYTWWPTSTSGSAGNMAYPSTGVMILPSTTVTTGKAPTLSGSSVFTINSTTQANCQANDSNYGSYRMSTNNPNSTLQNTFSSAAYSSLNIGSLPAIYGHIGGSALTKSYSANANSHGYAIEGYMNTGAALRGMKWQYTRATNTLIAGYLENTAGDFATDGKITITNLPTSGRVFLFGGHANGSSSTSEYFSLRNDQGHNSTGSFVTTTTSATGSYASTTITAASTTSKMGVVITYINASGTATLNTDLKVYLSANNGSNYTQVTLVAQPDFATGVKSAKANDVTISNTGTQLKYKVEFANQASGSKVTRVTGISLQY